MQLLRELGHAPTLEEAPDATARPPAPGSANELRAVGEVHGADLVLTSSVEAQSMSFQLRLVLGGVSRGQAVARDLELVDLEPSPPLRQALEALLAEQQKAESATAFPPPPLQPEPQRQSSPVVVVGTPRLRVIRPPVPPAWHVQTGLGVLGLALRGDGVRERTMGSLDLRGGWRLPKAGGLELRFCLGAVYAARTAFLMFVGLAYLRPWRADLPLRWGAAVELGWAQVTSDNRGAAALLRGSPLLVWDLPQQLFVEAALPEILVLAGTDTSVGIGGSVRLGYRF